MRHLLRQARQSLRLQGQQHRRRADGSCGGGGENDVEGTTSTSIRSSDRSGGGASGSASSSSSTDLEALLPAGRGGEGSLDDLLYGGSSALLAACGLPEVLRLHPEQAAGGGPNGAAGVGAEGPGGDGSGDDSEWPLPAGGEGVKPMRPTQLPLPFHPSPPEGASPPSLPALAREWGLSDAATAASLVQLRQRQQGAARRREQQQQLLDPMQRLQRFRGTSGGVAPSAARRSAAPGAGGGERSAGRGGGGSGGRRQEAGRSTAPSGVAAPFHMHVSTLHL